MAKVNAKKKSRKPKVKPKKKLTRQQQRKEKKELKKQNKRLFFSRKTQNQLAEESSTQKQPVPKKKFAPAPKPDDDDESIASDFSDPEVDALMPKKKVKQPVVKQFAPPREDAVQQQKRELKRQKELKQSASKLRVKQLRLENEEEDKLIHRLEKKLKLNRTKDKNRLVRKMFNTDGLDWALELCLDDDEEREKQQLKERNKQKQQEMDNDDWSEDAADMEADFSEEEAPLSGSEASSADEDEVEATNKEPEITEDIYGRKRDKQGNILTEEPQPQKYIPPHQRATVATAANDADAERLERLKKQCKGLLNRLSEANLHKIATGIEQLYMQHARYHMNATLGELLSEALITPTLCNERMLQEHMVLLAYLHAHIGSEIGAHFLQLFVEQFVSYENNEDKRLNNVVLLLCYMYMFRMFEHRLLLELIQRLTEQLSEKAVECLLLIFQSVGLKLRKDDPVSFKQLLLDVQQRVSASASSLEIQQNLRLKFMVEMLQALKNNNLHKLPQVDPQLPEQLRKRLKGMLRTDKYVTTLNIALADLLRADQVGKWWIVGSAWTGKLEETRETPTTTPNAQRFSDKLMALARAQHMNTEERRQIFCIVMSAEDYVDAYEKILHLALKDQRSIAYVIIHCCVQERRVNPYYAHLALKFCNYNRKFQLAFQFASWDRINELAALSKLQIRNLAHFLLQLIARGGLALSVLKVVDFVQLGKRHMLLMQQIMRGLLLWSSEGESGISRAQIDQTFERVAKNPKLQAFKNGLRLFIQHFLRQETTGEATQDAVLLQRIDSIDNILAYIDL